MNVLIPSLLHSYTGGDGRVVCQGATLGAVLMDLEGRWPGIGFRIVDEQGRIRPHLRFYADGHPVTAASPLANTRELLLVAALSGGGGTPGGLRADRGLPQSGRLQGKAMAPWEETYG